MSERVRTTPRDGYDGANRPASAAPPEEGPLLPLPAQAGGTYSYDWVGNMKAAASSNPWQYNAADQLTLWPGMHSYEYDPNGALTSVQTADGQTEQQTFTYHPNGLMNTATFNNQTQTLTNLWDADEHRVQFSVGEDDYTAVFDVTAGIPAVIKEVNPQGTVYYVREPGGELICRVVGESRWYYHFDELGSTRLITDDSGAVTDRYSYDAYGAVISHDRNTGTINQPYQYVGQLGYYTHWMTPEFGWLQLGVRFYDPETGRFERQDPMRTDIAHYPYASDQPLIAGDPDGRFAILLAAGVTVGAGQLAGLGTAIAWLLCQQNADCREALLNAIDMALEKMRELGDTLGRCRIKCEIRSDPPHHKWRRLIHGAPRSCWMMHVHINCATPATGWFWGPGGIRIPYGPCFRYRGGFPPGVWK